MPSFHVLLIMFAILFFIIAAFPTPTSVRFEWLAGACLAATLLV